MKEKKTVPPLLHAQRATPRTDEAHRKWMNGELSWTTFAGGLEEELAAKPTSEAAADIANKRIKVGTFGILERGGKILLGLRKADDETFPSCWCHPGGGVEYGENVNAALHREFLEEVRMEVEIQNDYTSIHEYFGEGRHVMLVFKAVLSQTQFPTCGDGFCGVGWFTIEEIRSLAKEGYTTPLTIVAAEAWHKWFAHSMDE